MEDMQVTASGYDFRPAHAAMQRYVDGNLLSGFSSAVLVGRDLVDVKCIGWADKEAQIPLRVDHIFRVFSNTKLITSCAALLLFEEGRFQLDDPIERFIPQLANRRVLRPDATSLDQTEPAVRPITIRHLMSHNSGLSYGLLDPGTLIFNVYNERKVVNPATTLAQMMDVLADLPLVFHPGTSWEYSVATDVLARLVEVISGQRFDPFIQSRILGPLGMVDTGFVASDRNRLVAFYTGADPIDPMKPGLNRADDAPYPGAYLRPVPRQSGGSGLVSTLPDMVALIRSLLPGGPTLLEPDTIELMMTNQLAHGVWTRFPAYGELKAGGTGSRERWSLSLLPSTIRRREASSFGADAQARNGGFRQKRIPQAWSWRSARWALLIRFDRVQAARVRSGERADRMASHPLHESGSGTSRAPRNRAASARAANSVGVSPSCLR